MSLVLYLLFVLSGAAGLVYELVWTRYLGLFVGHAAYAQVLVLVIFLGGMALGALAVGRRAERIRDPLLWYAGIEIAAGLIGLVFHDAYLAATGFAYRVVFPALESVPLVTAVKWALAGSLILPQSVLLGMTFPLMSAGLLRRRPEAPGRRIAVLYFANSIGAAAGVLVAGFYLVALAGLPGTVLAGASANLLVGLAAFVVARRSPCPAAPAPVASGAESSDAAQPAARRLPRVLLWVSFGTAVASFTYEIGWIRMLSLVLGSATHSFELMLSAFILGLALGALWVRRRADRFRSPALALAVVQWLMGTAALATLPLYWASFGWIGELLRGLARTDQGYAIFTLARYTLCLAIMLPATFCAGMTLPLITRILLAGPSGERALGTVYGVNTLGSILGAGAAGLLLLPLLGLKGLLIAGAAVDIGLGLWILRVAAPAKPAARWLGWVVPAAGAATVGVALAARGASPALLDSGVYRTGSVQEARAVDVRFHRDGRTATVTGKLVRADNVLSLSTNGKPDASLRARWLEGCGPGAVRGPLAGDEPTQVFAPLITLAHGPGARTAAVIGQGSGMSGHFLLASPRLQELVTIEIEPEMIAGSRIFYPANRRVFDDPRSHFVIDDAKAYFAAADRRFDLIFSEPSNPWVSGVSGLFTQEFYGRIRDYLTDRGVFGQWIHIYEMSDGLVLSVLAALHHAFPSYAVFATGGGDLLVVASNQRALPAPDWSVLGFPLLAQDLCRFTELTPTMLEATWLADRTTLSPLLDRYPAGNSDFYPVLDLGAERARFLGHSAEGIAGLLRSGFDFTAPVAGRRIAPAEWVDAAVPDIARMRYLALGAALEPGAPEPVDSGVAAAAAAARYRRQEWDAGLRAGGEPASWGEWFNATMRVEGDRANGTAGFADDALFRVAFAFLDRHRGPAPVRDALAFWHAVRVWDFERAAGAAEPLVSRALRGENWLEPDLLRDAAVVALLRTGDVQGARRVFAELAPLSRRRPDDFRVRLLDSYITLAEAREAGRQLGRGPTELSRAR